MEEKEKAVPPFFRALALGLMVTAGGNIMKGDYRPTPTVILCALGLILFLVPYRWEWIKGKLAPRLAESITAVAADFRYWLAIIAAMWFWMIIPPLLQTIQGNDPVALMKSDVKALNIAVKQYLLPRHLEFMQEKNISYELSRFPSREVVVNIIKGDNEAGSYAMEIVGAIRRGGWIVNQINYVNEDRAQAGISIERRVPISWPASTDDPKNPSADHILHDALGSAGIVSGTGGGGDHDPKFRAQAKFVILFPLAGKHAFPLRFV
jgi:hypothetical protein